MRHTKQLPNPAVPPARRVMVPRENFACVDNPGGYFRGNIFVQQACPFFSSLTFYLIECTQMTSQLL